MRLAASWFLAVLLCAADVWLAEAVLFRPGSVWAGAFGELAEQTGAAQWEPTGRLAAGVLHALAALFVLLPSQRRFGAVLTLLLSAAAAALYILWIGPQAPVDGVAASAGAGLAETAAQGRLLYLALVMALGALALVIVHPARDVDRLRLA